MIYTKDNPKLVERYYLSFKDRENFTGVVKDKYNEIAYFLNGKYHRTDGPAIERANGNKCWYLNGKVHRICGHAVEYVDGTKEWYLNEQLHREDGPAVEFADGNKHWYLKNILYGINNDFTNESWIRFVKLGLLK